MRIIRNVAWFLAGIVLTVVLLASTDNLPKAWAADPYACIRQGLTAYLHNGNIPETEFTIVYKLPTCYGASSYAVKKTYIYDKMVAVTYRKY